MTCGQQSNFSPKTARERVRLGFNFAAVLGPSEALSTATFSLALSSGTTDPGMGTMLEGSPVFDLSPIVKQLVTGGLGGNTYALTVAVTTSHGQTFEETALFEVTP
jgi:hypothetical protein